jgi:hypothetical protein
MHSRLGTGTKIQLEVRAGSVQNRQKIQVNIWCVIVLLTGLIPCGWAQPLAGKTEQAPSLRLEQFSLLALSLTERRAVLSKPDKQMLVLKTGDTVPGTTAVLSQVLPDKLVFDETPAGGQGKQVVWMYKTAPGTPARLERFSVLAPVTPAPVTQPVTLSTAIRVGEGATSSAGRKP